MIVPGVVPLTGVALIPAPEQLEPSVTVKAAPGDALVTEIVGREDWDDTTAPGW